MRHYFTLDGKSSADFNCYIARSNMFDGPEHDDETVEIPGRNGTLVFSNERFRNFSGNLYCYIPGNMRENVDALRAFVSARHGYARYEDTLHPLEYRMVRYAGGFSIDTSDRVGAAFDLKFDCKPQRFLKSGETTMTLTSAGTLYNATAYKARPIVTCYGTSGAVTINGVSVAATGLTSHVTLDCDAMEAYEGATSRNASTTLTNGEFPALSPGNNAVSFTGFSRVEIIPRWWTV